MSIILSVALPQFIYPVTALQYYFQTLKGLEDCDETDGKNMGLMLMDELFNSKEDRKTTITVFCKKMRIMREWNDVYPWGGDLLNAITLNSSIPPPKVKRLKLIDMSAAEAIASGQSLEHQIPTLKLLLMNGFHLFRQ